MTKARPLESSLISWFVKYTEGVELVVHECFHTPETLGEILDTPPPQAVFITSYIHTPPQAFGKIMSAVQPRTPIASPQRGPRLDLPRYQCG